MVDERLPDLTPGEAAVLWPEPVANMAGPH